MDKSRRAQVLNTTKFHSKFLWHFIYCFSFTRLFIDFTFNDYFLTQPAQYPFPLWSRATTTSKKPFIHTIKYQYLQLRILNFIDWFICLPSECPIQKSVQTLIPLLKKPKGIGRSKFLGEINPEDSSIIKKLLFRYSVLDFGRTRFWLASRRS